MKNETGSVLLNYGLVAGMVTLGAFFFGAPVERAAQFGLWAGAALMVGIALLGIFTVEQAIIAAVSTSIATMITFNTSLSGTAVFCAVLTVSFTGYGFWAKTHYPKEYPGIADDPELQRQFPGAYRQHLRHKETGKAAKGKWN